MLIPRTAPLALLRVPGRRCPVADPSCYVFTATTDAGSRILPAVGMFIRPVGACGFRFCYRVHRVHVIRVQCDRWGMRNQLPFDDGHVSVARSSVDLLPLRPGVWKVDGPSRGHGSPMYFVLTGQPDGQFDMFGSMA